jgi:hypothetical protein
MNVFIDKNWPPEVSRIAQNLWLAYAYKESNTSGPFALEEHIRSNKFRHYRSGLTQPSNATVREVENVARGSAAVLGHRAWRLLADEELTEQDHLNALESHGIRDNTRLFVDRKLPILIKAKDICFLDRLEITLDIASLAALRGDIFLIERSRQQSALLFKTPPSYATVDLMSDLPALVNRWSDLKHAKAKKQQVAIINARIDLRLTVLAILILLSPMFQKHAGMQALSVITGVFLLWASFEPELRYWWAGSKQNPTH